MGFHIGPCSYAYVTSSDNSCLGLLTQNLKVFPALCSASPWAPDTGLAGWSLEVGGYSAFSTGNLEIRGKEFSETPG